MIGFEQGDRPYFQNIFKPEIKAQPQKMLMAAFYINSGEAIRELAVHNKTVYCHSASFNLSWSKTGQISHVPSLHRNTAQKN